MDPPGTVFYLVPQTKDALDIVQDPDNQERRCRVPHIAHGPVLRIGLDQRLKNAPYLASFGRREHNDVILRKRFARNGQCYFNFNKETGEPLLHDISEKKDTELFEIIYETDKFRGVVEKQGPTQIRKSSRQCAVVLSYDTYNNRERKWIFQMRDAVFYLIPPRRQAQDETALTQERLAFACQPDPEMTEEGTIQRLITLGLQSNAMTSTYQSSFNPHNLRLQSPFEPNEEDVIRYIKLRPLGKGGQAEVHEVVDLHNGNHYACKIVATKTDIPQWNVDTEWKFKKRVETEIELVKEIHHHDHIVEYKYTQGFKLGQTIEIFMDIYRGSLHNLISSYRPRQQGLVQAQPPIDTEVRALVDRMLSQILSALDYVHTYDPQIIHRDIKPENILYLGGNLDNVRFFLTDFGIAKTVATSKTIVGTNWYMAPEVRENGKHTPKIDIFGLGVTVLECFMELPHDQRTRVIRDWNKEWYRELQINLRQHASRYASMLSHTAEQRPTARWLLDKFFSPQIPQNMVRSTLAMAPPLADPAGVPMISAARLSLFNHENATMTPAALAIREDTTMVSAAPLSLTRQVDVTMVSAAPLTKASDANPFRSKSLARPSLKTPGSNRSTQPVKSGGSVKSANSTQSSKRRRNDHNHKAPSHNGHSTSRPTGVVKRNPSGRPSARSVQND